MSKMDERGQAFERKEAMSAEKKFKIESRRNKLLGEWASNLLKYDEEGTQAYAKALITTDMSEAGDEVVLKKILEDLNAANIMVTEHEVRAKINECYAEATKAVEAED